MADSYARPDEGTKRLRGELINQPTRGVDRFISYRLKIDSTAVRKVMSIYNHQHLIIDQLLMLISRYNPPHTCRGNLALFERTINIATN